MGSLRVSCPGGGLPLLGGRLGEDASLAGCWP